MDWKIIAVIALAVALAVVPFWPSIEFAFKKAKESGGSDRNKLSFWTEFFGQ